MTKEQWRIRVSGYGTFDFHGTETEAEDMRRHKSRWERGVGHKWRVANQTEVDKLTAQICSIWDAGSGVPAKLMKALAKAKFEESLSGRC